MENKRQHWVPKFYLNVFAIPETRADKEPQIYALDVSGNSNLKVFPVATKNVANDAYLYSPVDGDGNRDNTFEKKLALLESMFAKLWQMIGAGSGVALEGAYRKALALFVANMWARHPRQRKVADHDLNEIVNAIQNHLDGGEQRVDQIEIETVLGTQALTREEYEDERPKSPNDYHRHFIEVVEDQTGDIAQLLLDKRWTVFVSEENKFITSDNPVLLTGPADKPFGFGTPGVSISVPLTPDKLLVIDDGEGWRGRYSLISERPGFGRVREAPFNMQTASNAYRFIYAPHNELFRVLHQGNWFRDNIEMSDPASPFFALNEVDPIGWTAKWVE